MKTLSDMLDKIAEKYPDDQDVMEAVAMAAGEGDEEESFDDELDFSEDEEMSEDAPLDFESLMGEDLGEEEDLEDEEFSMPAKKKKKF